MTTIVDVLKRCARQCSVDEPSSWVNATDEDAVALRDDFLLETVDEILERADLPDPIGAQTTITGTGAETYSLPSNFKRLARDGWAVYETTTSRRKCVPVKQDGVWTHLGTVGAVGVDRYYKLTGYEGNFSISFYENPGSGVSITVSYVTENWMKNSSGTSGKAFTDADDVMLLPRQLVEAGVVYRFRERNGLDAADKKMEFETRLNRLTNDMRTIRNVSFSEAHVDAPWDIPVPDFIPAS